MLWFFCELIRLTLLMDLNGVQDSNLESGIKVA